jgi:glucose/mannose-6-phosphate isomerase
LAKSVAQFEILPEADHNMVAGVLNPREMPGSTMVLFLRAAGNHPRNLARIEATREVLMDEGFGVEVVDAGGETLLAQQWTALHFGDYLSYYLAMAYGADPTPIQAIDDLKVRMRG